MVKVTEYCGYGFRLAVWALLLTSAVICAQPGTADRRAQSASPRDAPTDDKKPEKIHRLESVTWNPMTCELTWVVSTGIRVGRRYTSSEQKTYQISMDIAVMQVGAERRAFQMQEAENVHTLMDIISRYAADSTIWWDNGEGEKIDPIDGPVAASSGTKERVTSQGLPITPARSSSSAPQASKSAEPK